MKHIRFRHIATSLIMAALALPNPLTAQTPNQTAPQSDARQPSDMVVRIKSFDKAAPPLAPARPAGDLARRKYKSQHMLQISGLGDVQLPFDVQSLAAIWPPLQHDSDMAILDVTIARDGKVASCKPGLSTEPSIGSQICQRLSGKALFHWPSAPPFSGDFAYSQLMFSAEPRPPVPTQLRIVKSGTGLATKVQAIDSRNGNTCLVQISGKYIYPPRDKEICAFALNQAAARGKAMPKANGETWHTASIEFDLAAPKGYKPGKSFPLEVRWTETADSTFGQTRYDVPPLAAADKMPPLGRLQMPDLGDEAERAYFAKFDKRNFNKGRIWLTRVRVGIRLDGSIASCQPTVSFGSAFADQYLCDAIMRKGRYQFNQAQPIPPGMKPDAVIKYVEQTMRTDGAFVTFDAPQFDNE